MGAVGTLVRKVFNHARHHGPVATVALVPKNIQVLVRVFLDGRFDRRHKVDTSGKIHLDDLFVTGDNKGEGVYYEPTPRKVFQTIISNLSIDPREFEFVDFGSGKGRVLLLAARYPFRKITGVEFAPALVEVAKRNIGTFSDRHQQCRSFDLLCMDATQYDIPDGKAILYFFNPFSRNLMEKVARNIEASYRKTGEKKIIIYYHPQSRSVFEALPFLRQLTAHKKVVDFASPQFRGFAIYETVDSAVVEEAMTQRRDSSDA